MAVLDSEYDFKFGFIGLRPKCKMQNAKCKIKARKNGDTKNSLQKFLFGDNTFSGVELQKATIKSAFATAKGFINFAFCILHLQFIGHKPDKLQFTV